MSGCLMIGYLGSIKYKDRASKKSIRKLSVWHFRQGVLTELNIVIVRILYSEKGNNILVH